MIKLVLVITKSNHSKNTLSKNCLFESPVLTVYIVTFTIGLSTKTAISFLVWICRISEWLTLLRIHGLSFSSSSSDMSSKSSRSGSLDCLVCLASRLVSERRLPRTWDILSGWRMEDMVGRTEAAGNNEDSWEVKMEVVVVDKLK